MLRRRNPIIKKTGRYIKITSSVASKRSEEREVENLLIWSIHEVIEYGNPRSYGVWVMGVNKPFFLMKYLYKQVDKPKVKTNERTEKTIVRRRRNDSRIPEKRKRRKTNLPVKRSRRIH